MDKKFVDVFPTLQLNKELLNLLEDVMVEKVTTNRQNDFLRIYLSSTHLIMKEKIILIEKQIKKQLFSHMPINIKILFLMGCQAVRQL